MNEPTNPIPPMRPTTPATNWAPPPEPLLEPAESAPMGFVDFTRTVTWGSADHPKKPWKRKRVWAFAFAGLAVVGSVVAESDDAKTEPISAAEAEGSVALQGLIGEVNRSAVPSSTDAPSSDPADNAPITTAAPATSAPATTTAPTTAASSTTQLPTTAPATTPATTTAAPTASQPPTTAAPTTATPATARAVSYANCSEVRAAGAAPIRRGDPGFRDKFDRDGDGVGCE